MTERIHLFVFAITGRRVIDARRLEVVVVGDTIEPGTVQSIGTVAFRVDGIQYILENLVRARAVLEDAECTRDFLRFDRTSLSNRDSTSVNVTKPLLLVSTILKN